MFPSLSTPTRFRHGAAGFVLLGASALWAQACSSTAATDGAPDAGGADTAPPSCAVQPDAPSCDAPVDVATADDVFARIAMLPEASDTTVMPSSGAALLPSGDLRITASIELDVAKLRARMPLCAKADAGGGTGADFCKDSMFAPEKPFHTSQSPLAGDFDQRRLGTTYPQGVSCSTPSPAPGDGCDRLSIAAGSVVRFQRVVETFTMAPDANSHYVRVVRPCSTRCADDEVRCAASKTCIKAGKDYCLLCDGLSAGICACRGRCAPQPQGTKCQYWSSDDTIGSGTCASGKCGN